MYEKKLKVLFTVQSQLAIIFQEGLVKQSCYAKLSDNERLGERRKYQARTIEKADTKGSITNKGISPF